MTVHAIVVGAGLARLLTASELVGAGYDEVLIAGQVPGSPIGWARHRFYTAPGFTRAPRCP
ncbi:MAG: hypothetical protein IH941_00905 [Acidobacteria bacterium]|nr:hypothetical protein [Acidobacteriota bacterium]